MKARYRNKVGKVIIEVFDGQKWKYVKTLGDPLIEFREECLAKVSSNTPKKDEIKPQTFAQSPLTAVLKQDTLTEEDIEKKKKEALNKLMDDILS